jgi:adenine phosphoribosyltransferase
MPLQSLTASLPLPPDSYQKAIPVPDTRLKALDLIRDVPDFPQPGILFKDITPVLGHPEAFREVISALAERVRALRPDVLVGIESRGFLFAAPLAVELGVGLAPVRKPGKLPYTTRSREYALEYGTNRVELHTDAIEEGQRVVIIDDLLATGGTAEAAGHLVRESGGTVVGYTFLVELTFLPGRARLADADVTALIAY